MTHSRQWLSFALLVMVAAGCRGDLSEDPPIHFNPNMDNQERLDPQEPYKRFGDELAMRKAPINHPVSVAANAGLTRCDWRSR